MLIAGMAAALTLVFAVALTLSLTRTPPLAPCASPGTAARRSG